MENNYQKLRALNIDIGRAEARGDKQFFETLLAHHFAMHRANGEFDDRKGFLANVKESGERVTEIQSITFFEANRALVSCVVAMETSDGATRSTMLGYSLARCRIGTGNCWHGRTSA
jgi:hypothetical protein